VLCDQTLTALASSLRTLSLGSGEDFQVIAFSIDPEDTPATAMAKRKAIVPRYSPRRPVSGWHFLTGAPAEIQKLTEALRFRYTYNGKNHTYGHASGIVILTPAGRLSRYLPGIDFSPQDLRLSLVEASFGRIGSIVDRVILYCYQYNPATGRYGAVVMRILWLAAFLTLAGIVLCVLAVQRRERRQRAIGREA
jgi:protein SCO1/2